MALLKTVMNYLTKFQSKNAPESQNFIGEAVATLASKNDESAKVAAIAAALHHHDLETSDVRAKVAAIAVALHHHELETSQPSGIAGVAALIAAMHHHTKTKK